MADRTETARDAAHRTDLDLAATYGRQISKAAERAHDMRFRGAQAARLLSRDQRALPSAEAFTDDMLADFDRLAVVVERIRAVRAAPALERAA